MQGVLRGRRRHQCKKFSSNLCSRNKTTLTVKSESGIRRPTSGGIMNEKFYEVRRGRKSQLVLAWSKDLKGKGCSLYPSRVCLHIHMLAALDKWISGPPNNSNAFSSPSSIQQPFILSFSKWQDLRQNINRYVFRQRCQTWKAWAF